MSHLYIHKHTHIQTQTQTQTHTYTHTSRIKFFNENIRSNKDCGPIARNKRKYLHYLSKMIEKSKMKKFVFSKDFV